MSAIIYRYAEEKARRLSLRYKTNVSTVNRLLGRTDCGEVDLWTKLQQEWDKRREDGLYPYR